MTLINKINESYEANQEVAKQLPAQYNVSDFLVPGKLLRHISGISREKDKIVRAYEFAILGFLQAVQVGSYYSLYNMFN